MRARLFVLWVVVLVAAQSFGHAPVRAQAAPVDAAANEAKAREAFQRGRIHYENGEFAAAASAFEEAYTLSGRDALLYNLYLAYRDANEQEKAAESLRNYLSRVEVIENRAQLEARLKALEAGIAEKQQAAEQQQAAEAKEPAQVAQPVAVSTSDQAEAPGKWWLVPAIVTGAGAALMIGSIGTGLSAKKKQDDLEKQCTDGVCDASLKATADSGKTLSYVTDALLFGGALVAATGVVLLFIKKPKKRAEAEPQPSVACSTRGCAGSVTFRF